VPRCVAFDSWFSVLDNLKLIRSYGWGWLTRLNRIRLRRSKALRLVNPERTGNRYLHEVQQRLTQLLLLNLRITCC